MAQVVERRRRRLSPPDLHRRMSAAPTLLFDSSLALLSFSSPSLMHPRISPRRKGRCAHGRSPTPLARPLDARPLAPLRLQLQRNDGELSRKIRGARHCAAPPRRRWSPLPSSTWRSRSRRWVAASDAAAASICSFCRNSSDPWHPSGSVVLDRVNT